MDEVDAVLLRGFCWIERGRGINELRFGKLQGGCKEVR